MLVISIVTGTYNRLPLLQNMMQSVTRQLPESVDYQFVIVDGGSTDGTQEWLKTQPRVLLIQHDGLHGAIRAFCDGANFATGEYVVMANDDVTFEGYGLLAAVAYLEDNPLCGAVAFADNRVRSYQYDVALHPVRAATGERVLVNYAQVGMFRRWLGDLAGWWGADDPLMGGARTYGGDNYLSARIWEMGYTVDAVTGCYITDSIYRDELRANNAQGGDRDSQIFYSRFPDGAVFGSIELIPPPRNERLRIFYLPIYEVGHIVQRQQKRGLYNALSQVGVTLEYDYIEEARRGANIHSEIVNLAKAFRPHVVLTQCHDGELIQERTITALRTECPTAICINWNGDYWPDTQLKASTIALLRWYDLVLVVNDDIRKEYEALGIPSAYWQIASEAPTHLPDMPAHDVLLLANNYSPERVKLGALLRSLPYNVGIYGMGWEDADGSTLYDYAASHALMRNAKIVIGDNQFSDASGYVSNRFFETLYAGGFLLHQPIKNLQRLTGFRNNAHYATFETLEDLPEQIAYWMSHEDEREKIRHAGQRYARKKHTFEARVKELFTEIIPDKVRARELA